MALEIGGRGRVRRRKRVPCRIDDVDAFGDVAAQERVRALDAGVQQRDRHAASVVARKRKTGHTPERLRQVATAEQRRRDGRGVRDADRIDPAHTVVTLEQRDGARIEGGGEPETTRAKLNVGCTRTPCTARREIRRR